MMELMRFRVLNFIKHIDDMFAIVEYEVLKKVVCVLEKLTARDGEWFLALASTFRVCGEIVCLISVGYLQVIALNCKIVKNDFIDIVLITIISIAVLLKVGRENFVDRIFAHNAAKLHKIIETQ